MDLLKHLRKIIVFLSFILYTSIAIPNELLQTQEFQERVLALSPSPTSVEIKFVLSQPKGSKVDEKISNGYELDKSKWPGVAIATFNSKDGSTGSCTATIIGPNTVLTAAHCIDKGDGALFSASILTKKKSYLITCSLHPAYLDSPIMKSPRHDADYALCIVDNIIKEVIYENIDVKHKIEKGNEVFLVGYGCTNLKINENGLSTFKHSDGPLRGGTDKIEVINTSVVRGKTGSMVETFSPNGDEPTVCPGDSGGPAFFFKGNKRSIVAINSSISWKWKGSGKGASFSSILAPLGHSIFTSFLDNWLVSNPSAKVAGYN